MNQCFQGITECGEVVWGGAAHGEETLGDTRGAGFELFPGRGERDVDPPFVVEGPSALDQADGFEAFQQG